MPIEEEGFASFTAHEIAFQLPAFVVLAVIDPKIAGINQPFPAIYGLGTKAAQRQGEAVERIEALCPCRFPVFSLDFFDIDTKVEVKSHEWRKFDCW